MSVLTPVAAVLSVFIAYYFGQKSRATPLRAAVYSKQIDLAYEMSEKLEEWGEDMRGAYMKIDSRTPLESGKQKGGVLDYLRSVMVMPRDAVQSIQRCEILLPNVMIEELDNAVSALLRRNVKISMLISSAVIDRELVEDPETAETLREVQDTDIQELRDEYREACSDFRETCRREFGIEALTGETREAVEQLESTLVPQQVLSEFQKGE